jgi:hypothetical protein
MMFLVEACVLQSFLVLHAELLPNLTSFSFIILFACFRPSLHTLSCLCTLLRIHAFYP